MPTSEVTTNLLVPKTLKLRPGTCPAARRDLPPTSCFIVPPGSASSPAQAVPDRSTPRHQSEPFQEPRNSTADTLPRSLDPHPCQHQSIPLDRPPPRSKPHSA